MSRTIRATFFAGALIALLAGLSGCASSRTAVPAAPEAAPSEDPGPAAGAAVRVITPDLDAGRIVYVGGLARGLPAAGVHDDLYARALVIEDPAGDSLGLVVLDLIGFFHDDIVAIREDLRARHPEVALDHLAVASTHTHAGPDVIGLWTPIGETVDAAYIARVRAIAVEAVAEAWRNRRPASIVVAQADAAGLAKDTRLPKLTDDHVLVMGLRDRKDGAPIATLVNWNSHPSVHGEDNDLISADFPRAVVSVMEREWGGTALYTSGALGGQIGSGRVKLQDPDTGARPATKLRLAEIVGGTIARKALVALRASEQIGPEARPSVRVRARAIRIPLDNARFTTGLAIGLIHPRRLYPKDDPDHPGWLPSELPDLTTLRPGVYDLASEVAVADVGPARWALLPGEIYPELSLGVYQDPQDPGADFPGADREPPLRPGSTRPLFVIGLANDEIGYIIPRSQWDLIPPFAYGRDEAQYGEMNSAGPLTAPIVMGAVAGIVAQMDAAMTQAAPQQEDPAAGGRKGD